MDGYSVRNCINPVQYKEKSSNTLTTYPPLDKRNELGMSVLISMFTALVISRFLVYAAYHFGLHDKKWYGKPRTIKTRDFVRTGN